MVKWIFFDVGCTLIDETQMWAHRNEETRQMAEAIGRKVTVQEIMDKETACAEAYIPIAPTVAKWLGLPDMAKYRGEFEELYPGAEEVLAKLHKHYKLGVIANQPDNLDGRLEKLGILKHFDVVVSSHDVGCVKPDERIFRGMRNGGRQTGQRHRTRKETRIYYGAHPSGRVRNATTEKQTQHPRLLRNRRLRFA